jgi:hypothetical protein
LDNYDRNGTIQYINHSYNILSDIYLKYPPKIGIGEFTRAIYRIAKRIFDARNLLFFHPITLGFFTRFYLENNIDWMWEDMRTQFIELTSKDHPIINEEVKNKYENILKGQTNLTYQTNYSVTTGYTKVTIGNIVYRMKSSTQPAKPELNNPMDNLLEKNILAKIKRLYSNIKNEKAYYKYLNYGLSQITKRYCIYFLHFQPEYTVNGLGRFFMDQSILIQNIAQCLPSGTILYVKEHKPMIGLRNESFYKKISSLKRKPLTRKRSL